MTLRVAPLIYEIVKMGCERSGCGLTSFPFRAVAASAEGKSLKVTKVQS